MRRRSVHLAFAAGCAMAGCAVLYSGWQWWQAKQVDDAIVAAGRVEAPADSPASEEGRLAQALALARSGATDAAIRACKELTDSPRQDIRQTALYDLGNLYLREALKDGAEEAERHAPLIELAKQSYRKLLRRSGDDWDARYNLELALRLAPERDEEAVESSEPAVPKERAITTMQGHKLVLP